MNLEEARKFFAADAFAVNRAGAVIDEVGDGFALQHGIRKGDI